LLVSIATQANRLRVDKQQTILIHTQVNLRWLMAWASSPRLQNCAGRNACAAGGRIAAEVVDEPEKQGESGAQDETRDDGEVEGGVWSAMDDVSGEFAQAEWEPSGEIQESARYYESGANE
jgi:hypothetical protein